MNAMLPRSDLEFEPSAAIPGPQEPWRMSFGELAVALSLCDIGSERASHLEQELGRRLAGQGRSKSRHAAALWFLVGGLVAMTGFQFGSGMRALALRATAPAPAVASAILPVRALPQLRSD